MYEILYFILGALLGIVLVIWISFLGIIKSDRQRKEKDTISRDLLGRPKKAQIIRRDDTIDEILKKDV